MGKYEISIFCGIDSVRIVRVKFQQSILNRFHVENQYLVSFLSRRVMLNFLQIQVLLLIATQEPP